VPLTADDSTRAALREAELESRPPAGPKVFQTDGVSLFVEHLGKFLNVTQEGQLAMRQVLDAHLRRLDSDGQGLAERLFPFTRAGAHGGVELNGHRG
jgi:hypothetical protein